MKLIHYPSRSFVKKTNSLEVKKNEEYQALENEIAGLIDQQSLKEDDTYRNPFKT